MKAVVQRVIDASVSVNGELRGSIKSGLLVYLGVARDDNTLDADWLAEKIINLRIFNDMEGKMNLSLLETVNQKNSPVNDTVNQDNIMVNVNHDKNTVNKAPRTISSDGSPNGVLVISQFTLLGNAVKGRRPSWGNAAPPEKARELYLYFIEKIREKTLCESGEFQAHMKVSYTNDGPVTILLDTKQMSN
jgi:D-tyrosyl-tRNA(Tyr) deacylase